MNHNIDGSLHQWLKINHDHVLIKNSGNFFQFFVHVNENSSQEVSKVNKPSIFINNEDNLLEIVGKDKWINETSRQLKNDELSNSAHVINDNGHNNDTTNTDVLNYPIKCNNSFGICEELPNYPNDWLEKELDANPTFRYLEVNETNEESQDEVKLVNRFGEPDLQPLCHSKKQYIRPKAARTESDEVSLVVNNDKFVQLIEVEICNNKKSTCDFSENFPAGYISVCEQKYVHRKLLGMDSSKKLEPKIFKIPAGCCCGVWLQDGF